jgi:hypothetical protein
MPVRSKLNNRSSFKGGDQVKAKPKAFLFATVILIPVILLSVSTGCGQPASPNPAQANPPETPPSAIDDTPPSPNAEPQPSPEPEPPREANQVNIVYFHRTQRCHSCQYSEAQTSATLEKYFADELASGKITFVSVDVQDENNVEIIEKYGAFGPQLFISVLERNGETIEEVQEFWDFIDDDDGFSNLIIDKVNEALKGSL